MEVGHKSNVREVQYVHAPSRGSSQRLKYKRRGRLARSKVTTMVLHSLFLPSCMFTYFHTPYSMHAVCVWSLACASHWSLRYQIDSVCTYVYSNIIYYVEYRFVPRPFLNFQCCTLKSERAWYTKSHVLDAA